MYAHHLYKKQFYHAREDLINHLYDAIETHLDQINDPNKYQMRTRTDVIQTNREFIQEALTYYKDGVDLPVYYSVDDEGGIVYTTPLIRHNIRIIKYSEIYRVYVTTPDPTFAWCHPN